MDTTKIADETSQDRRRFLAAMALAAAQLGLIGFAAAQPATTPAIKPGTNTSFGPLRQIDAGVLNVGYAEAGPAERARRASCCTAGPTTSTPMSMSRRCSRRPAIA